MFLLRIFRNLAVLVILTAGFSLIPRPVAAQSTCEPLGAYCAVPYHSQCCDGFCGWKHTCYNKPFWDQYCTTSAECCTGVCWNHRCQ